MTVVDLVVVVVVVVVIVPVVCDWGEKSGHACW